MKTPRAQILPALFLIFLLFLSSCTFNASLRSLDSELGKGDLISANLQKVFVDITDVTITEGSVAIINVAVNPVRDQDTVIYLTLSTSSSSNNRFNPIPMQITIPAGSTSKSVVLNTIDDALLQDQENWSFSISTDDPNIHADPGVLHVTLNDNDGGYVPGAPVANVPKLLKEFNAHPATVNKISALGKIFYVGTDAANGSELWVSDGTLNGTKLLKDIEPGPGSSAIDTFTHPSTSPYVFFYATTSTEGKELWRTDGTEQGTQIVKDIEPGSRGSSYDILLAHQDKIYFNANTTLDGTELYVSDGTTAGTKMLLESGIGSLGTYGNSMVAGNGTDVYISDYSSSSGENHFYKTDGNPGNVTTLVTRFSDGSSMWDDANLVLFYNGYLYFSYWGNNGYELFSSGGTNATTSMIADVYPGYSSSYASATEHILNGKVVVFHSWDSSGSATGFYLTDGTSAGSNKVTQSVFTSSHFGVIGGNKLVYAGCVGSYNCELWVSSGVNGDATMLKDIYPGTTGGNANSSSPSFAARIGDKIFFTANNATEGTELYVTDGTSAGTTLLKDINAGSASSSPSNFIVAGSNLVFTAKSDLYGEEIWITNGTPSGTVLYKDLYPGVKNSGTKNLALLDPTHLFFTAYNSVSQFASVYIGDLSNGNVTGFAHAMVETMNSETKNMVDYNGLVYFDAMDANQGNPLWVTNGTSTGTTKIKDLYPNITCSDINFLTVYNGSLFFVASSEASGTEIFTSNGTTAGTDVFKEIGPGSTGSYISSGFVKSATGKMFFTANDNSGVGAELFATDGTSAGTGLVKDLNNSSTTSGAQGYTAVPGTNKVFFYTTIPYGFWVSDGTNAGTVQITGLSSISSVSTAPKATNTGVFIQYLEASTYKQRFYFVDAATNTATFLNTTYATDLILGSPILNPTNGLFFYVTSNTTGTIINFWKSDGTSAGTSILQSFTPVGNNNVITMIGTVGNKTFIQYSNNNSSPYIRQLWVSDGTIAGTTLVDTATNASSVDYASGYSYNGYLYFTRYHATLGTELWKTDGTPANTMMVKDINPGSGNSYFVGLAVYNGKLYFSADDGTHGVELWRTDGTLLGTEMVADINPGLNSSTPTLAKVLAGKLYFTATKVLSGQEIWVYSE